MLVSRRSENMSPVPPTMQRPSEINKRVRAGRAGYLGGGRYESAFEREKKYTTYLSKTGPVYA
jgi:hypothetical protein